MSIKRNSSKTNGNGSNLNEEVFSNTSGYLKLFKSILEPFGRKLFVLIRAYMVSNFNEHKAVHITAYKEEK